MALQAELNLNDPKAISDTGNRIYSAQYKEEYEKKYPDQFVAINVLEGSATLGATMTEALTKAKGLHPEGFFHLIRVGHAGAFEVGWANRHVTSDRVS